MTFYRLAWLFFCFSILGWVLETSLAAIRTRRYVDRSVLFGPWCLVYGVSGLLITVGLRELSGNLFFLFLGSALLATVVEWLAGHLLENVSHTRWWDYSNRRFNLDGYICLSASVLWGLLGMVMVRWGNRLLLWALEFMPAPVRRVLVLALLVIFLLDGAATLLTLAGVVHKPHALERTGRRLDAVSARLGGWILRGCERRIQKAYPAASFVHEKREKPAVFAAGCSFAKLFWLFFIGAFLGDIVETIFCRVTGGVWMSRSSVVWGPFSLVWGIALALATLLLYRYKDKPASFLFWAGTLLGGVYEYLCSVFTELVFGTVFWDYSEIPFNLGGRINLLYCFFWGFAAVAWFRLAYPPLSRWIEAIPLTPGRVLTVVLVVFMAANVAASALAMGRYSQRAEGLPATASWQVWMDEHYPNEVMQRIYPNAVRTR